jgi:RHS repeat-associated protein
MLSKQTLLTGAILLFIISLTMIVLYEKPVQPGQAVQVAQEMPPHAQSGGTTYVYGQKLIAKKDSTITYNFQESIGSNTITTDDRGAIKSKFTSYPYGKTFQKESTFGGMQKYTFTGKEDDGHLMYYGARYYDPRIGKFTSVDPLSSTFANYDYANGNPLKFVDPTGTTSVYQLREMFPEDNPIPLVQRFSDILFEATPKDSISFSVFGPDLWEFGNSLADEDANELIRGFSSNLIQMNFDSSRGINLLFTGNTRVPIRYRDFSIDIDMTQSFRTNIIYNNFNIITEQVPLGKGKTEFKYDVETTVIRIDEGSAKPHLGILKSAGVAINNFFPGRDDIYIPDFEGLKYILKVQQFNQFFGVRDGSLVPISKVFDTNGNAWEPDEIPQVFQPELQRGVDEINKDWEKQVKSE